MLIKGPVDGGKREVTFVVLNDQILGNTVNLCGEFNDWSEASLEMHKTDEGDFRVSVLLETGRRYRYRYLVNGTQWENDWAADDYVPNEFGGEDSAVDI